MKHYLFKLAPWLLACAFQHASAAVLSVKLPGNSSTLTTTVGTEFDAKIFIDGIADLAGFDLTLTYNNAKLSALSLTSASIFGADTESFSGPFTAGSGAANLAEAISASSVATTGLNITAPTLLATVHFKALATGINSLLTVATPTPILSDFGGNSVGGAIQTAFVTINPAVVVPLPPTVLMLAPGLFFALVRKRKI